jgi:hypothetical protein
VRGVLTERAKMRRTSGLGRSANLHEPAFEVPIFHGAAESTPALAVARRSAS